MTERLFRVRLLRDTTYRDGNAKPQFTLHKGDVLLCGSMAWPWSSEKYAAILRESDGLTIERSIHKADVQRLGDV